MQNSNAVVKKDILHKYRYHYKGDLPECGLKIK